jgi:hypothetical protein
MKVPNKVLQTIEKVFVKMEEPTIEERRLVTAWVQEGLAKREALAAEAKLASVASKEGAQ